MKRLTEVLPIGLIAAIIVPGITISILGIHFLSQQKAARQLNLREEAKTELKQVGLLLENKTLDLVAKALATFPQKRDDLRKKERLLAAMKKLILQYSIVQFPFILDANKKFIFPIVQKSPRPFFKTVDHAAGDIRIKHLYQMASDLELSHSRYMEALLIYQQCLLQTPSLQSRLYLLNAVARCYFKMNKLPQALHYYHLLLDQFKNNLTKNAPLKFLVLRQLAKSYQLQGIIIRATSYYLTLYEEILKYETLVKGEDFLFLKNEALNFLNQYARNSPDQTTETETYKLPDNLQNQTRVDITLQWLFLEREPIDSLETHERSNSKRQLLKIEELYTSTDEKTRFYQMIKIVPLSSAKATPQSPILPITDQEGQIREICFLKIASPDGNTKEDIYLGFMLTPDYIKQQVFPALIKKQFKYPSLRSALMEKKSRPIVSPWAGHSHHLLTHTFDQVLSTKQLNVFSKEADFFSRQAKREIWINYGLIVTLIITMILSTLLFFRYLRREAEIIRLKAGFIDHASHTLKTPLTRMGLLAETIAQGWIEGKEQRATFAQAIIEETLHINQLVNNLLNFSRIEAGKMEYHFRRHNLQEVLENFLHQYSPMMKREGFQLDTLMDENLPPVNIDPEAITLVILNVCQNAMKYSPREKWIRFDLRLQENWLNLSISDHGIGIETKDQSKVFDKFYRSQDPNTQSLEGSGLGLFLAHEIVKAHGGGILLDSEPGSGSTFSILLPVYSEEEGIDENTDY